MVEKVIDLNDIELVGFLGIENKNIQEVETAFPKTKIAAPISSSPELLSVILPLILYD